MASWCLDSTRSSRAEGTREDTSKQNEIVSGFVPLGSEAALNFSNQYQTIDNIGVEWPRTGEVLTCHPLYSGFHVDVGLFDKNAILKVGIFVSEDNRVCPSIWKTNTSLEPRDLRGTIWYWNMADIRKRSICLPNGTPSTLLKGYGSKVELGSIVGAYRDTDGSLHFTVNGKDQGVAVDKLPRRFFYGWLRIGSNGEPGRVTVSHRVDIALDYYVKQVLTKERKLTVSKFKSKKKQKKIEIQTEEQNVQLPKEHADDNQDSSSCEEAKEPTATPAARRPKLAVMRYRMDSKPRGYCVIISITDFMTTSPTRTGAAMDERAMTSLFKELKFEVILKKNLTARQTEDEMVAYARKDHTKYDAFVCIIMSHGGEGDVILGVDGRKVSIEDLMAELKPQACPSLQGKPKFFIVQACRGELRENTSSYCPTGSSYSPSSLNSESMFEIDAGFSNLCVDSTLSRSLCPVEGDFILAFATTPGYVALRDTESGAVFVQVLADVFRKYHESCHVLELLTEVNRQVAEKVEELTNGSHWQIPAPSFTLRAMFYL